MSASAARLAVVQSISIMRLAAAVAFAAMAFQPFPVWLVLGIYLVAAVSDIVDGFLARRLSVASQAGSAIDLISDKSLTVVSLLYAAARGITVLPLAVIAVRELLSLGLRIVVVEGAPALPTSKIFGGVMAALLWGNTALLLAAGSNKQAFAAVQLVYWTCAAILAANMGWRLFVSRTRIMSALRGDPGTDSDSGTS